jgi:hypothetical protein
MLAMNSHQSGNQMKARTRFLSIGLPLSLPCRCPCPSRFHHLNALTASSHCFTQQSSMDISLSNHKNLTKNFKFY